jgi:hypothetical protein
MIDQYKLLQLGVAMQVGKSECFLSDSLDILRHIPDNCVDLIFTSPPYGKQREYDELDFKLVGQDWLDFCVERWVECNRICKGLVCWVVEGVTENFVYDGLPHLLAADLIRAGITLRHDGIYYRNGIPGTGGPDYLRNDKETILVSSKGRLEFFDLSIIGEPPTYQPGGNLTNRKPDGTRLNQKFKPPKFANTGSVVGGNTGRGHMGCRLSNDDFLNSLAQELSHETDAPFPEWLAEFFICAFCKPGGTVLDCFAGSGTTLAAAMKHGRVGIGIDLRASQIELSNGRLEIIQEYMNHG